jgi:hypothetical protein
MGYYNRTGLPKRHLKEAVCAICGDGTDRLNAKSLDGKSATRMLDLKKRDGVLEMEGKAGGRKRSSSIGIMGDGIGKMSTNRSSGDGLATVVLGCLHPFHEECIR